MMQTFLEAMDIQLWQHKQNKPPIANQSETTSASATVINTTHPVTLNDLKSTVANINTTPVTLNDLKTTVANCTACTLHTSRTQTVFGVGNIQAKLMLIGEAPGFYEDQQGEPFVGKAGQLLTAMLKAISLTREEVYIANILKCRPPENRDPQPAEIQCCTPFLLQQIALIQPKVILALGRIAGQFLLNSSQSMSSMRGKLHAWGRYKIPLIVTYHPAYLLRNPQDKTYAYKDLLLTQNTLKTLTEMSQGT